MANKGQEKYTSELTYRMVQIRRAALRWMIRGLVKWAPLEKPQEGYTIVIGCNTPLAKMLGANLHFLARQEMQHLDRVVVVLDRPREKMPHDIEPALRERFGALPLEFAYFTQKQADVVAKVRWPWVNSWLSWSIGIGMARTRYVMLQDFDAMLIRKDIAEERYRAIRSRGHQFVGVRFYGGNGIIPDDGLASTFELMLDAQHLRRSFRAIDAFNHVTRYKGRRVDFDTLLYCQTRGSLSSVVPIDEEDMVHPSQVICQFEEFYQGRGERVPASNNLPIVPYFLYVAQEPEAMAELTGQMEAAAPGARMVGFFGRELDLSGLAEAHVAWLAKQAYRLERAMGDDVRPDVKRYFKALDQFVARAKGRQPVLAGAQVV